MTDIHLDAVGGVAGDMFIAAMLDAMPDLSARVLADGAAVLPQEAGSISLVEGTSGAIRAVRFGLDAPAHGKVVEGHTLCEGASGGGTANPHDHDHGHDHTHSDHTPSPAKHAQDRQRDNNGSFRDMVARIQAAALHPRTAAQAVAILTIIAEAEAAIHRVPIEDVHFHEIADWDSLLDVVCAGSIAAALEGAIWTVSSLPRGSGLVRTAHGLLPVPAPATMAILQGFEWRDDGIAGERVTPTGAAILKHLVGAKTGVTAGRLAATGTGAGTRDLPGMPNVLRALIFEPSPAIPTDRVCVIEFEVDDMSGEEIGTAAERLRLANGVLDVSIGQAMGKKGRPVACFRVLSRTEAAETVAESCFAETSTIGLRLREERRLVLARETLAVGGIAAKAVARPGERTVKAESDALTGHTLAERRAMKWRAEHD